MSVIDPIGDMIARIRNAQERGKSKVSTPASRLRERVPNYDEQLARMRQHGIPTSKSSLVLDGFLEAAQRSVAKLKHLEDFT